MFGVAQQFLWPIKKMASVKTNKIIQSAMFLIMAQPKTNCDLRTFRVEDKKSKVVNNESWYTKVPSVF